MEVNVATVHRFSAVIALHPRQPDRMLAMHATLPQLGESALVRGVVDTVTIPRPVRFFILKVSVDDGLLLSAVQRDRVNDGVALWTRIKY